MYSDFYTGEILSLSNGVQSVLLDTDPMISSFGKDEAGEIYVVGLGGTVHRIINPNASPDDPPSAAVALSGEGFRTGQALTYQATLTPGFASTQVDISTSGRSCPTFLIDLGSRLDSSPYCMR